MITDVTKWYVEKTRRMRREQLTDKQIEAIWNEIKDQLEEYNV